MKIMLLAILPRRNFTLYLLDLLFAGVCPPSPPKSMLNKQTEHILLGRAPSPLQTTLNSGEAGEPSRFRLKLSIVEGWPQAGHIHYQVVPAINKAAATEFPKIPYVPQMLGGSGSSGDCQEQQTAKDSMARLEYLSLQPLTNKFCQCTYIASMNMYKTIQTMLSQHSYST